MAKNPHAYLSKQRDKQIASTTRIKEHYPSWTYTYSDGILVSTVDEKSKPYGKVRTKKRGWVKPGFDLDNFKKYYKYNNTDV